MALHEQSIGATDEWYTPPHVFEAMGDHKWFDVDVAAPQDKEKAAWVTANHFIRENSLEATWHGYVWMNPPFGGRNAMVPWLQKFTTHENGVCLVPDRTSAPWWQQYARSMGSVLFVAPKLKFIGANGDPGRSPAQGTCLMSLGSRGESALRDAAGNGLGILMKNTYNPTPAQPEK